MAQATPHASHAPPLAPRRLPPLGPQGCGPGCLRGCGPSRHWRTACVQWPCRQVPSSTGSSMSASGSTSTRSARSSSGQAAGPRDTTGTPPSGARKHGTGGTTACGSSTSWTHPGAAAIAAGKRRRCCCSRATRKTQAINSSTRSGACCHCWLARRGPCGAPCCQRTPTAAASSATACQPCRPWRMRPLPQRAGPRPVRRRRGRRCGMRATANASASRSYWCRPWAGSSRQCASGQGRTRRLSMLRLAS
mmetsp:Transcript_67568/g.187365  ORF Transcript_67568/g.187365 Transcript_67568/m.187365 type:complete len:249 (+) Transcript_67568:2-748(+)